MTDRFNFYDIYGFVLPGFAALCLFGACIFFTTGWFPEVAVGETVVALLLAYLLGAGIQEAVRVAVPSSWSRSDHGKRRYPSDFIVDNLQGGIKERYGAALLERFKLNIDDTNDGERASARNDGFKLARAVLIQEGVASYAQQFQGLQALFRGLAGVAWFGAWLCLAAGCAAWAWWTLPIAAVGLAWARNEGVGEKLDLVARWAAAAGILLGSAFGFSANIEVSRPAVLLCLGTVMLPLVIPLVTAHNRMAEAFVGEVIRAFAVSVSRPPASN